MTLPLFSPADRPGPDFVGLLRRLGHEPMGPRTDPGSGSDYVDVCLLCQEVAVESGWIKEGSPTTPIVPPERRRRKKLGLGSLFERKRPAPEEPVASEPILRRLSEHELAIVEIVTRTLESRD